MRVEVVHLSFATSIIFCLLSLLSFGISYAATFVLLVLSKSLRARIAAALGLLAAFSYAFIDLYLTSGGTGLMVMMPAGCLGIIVADVRKKLRDARTENDAESIKGWTGTMRILLTVMLPVILLIAMSARMR